MSIRNNGVTPQEAQGAYLRWVSFLGSVVGMLLLAYGHKLHAAIVCLEPSTLIFPDDVQNRITITFIAGIAVLIPSTIVGIYSLWPDVVTQSSEGKVGRVKVVMYVLFFIGLIAITAVILNEILRC